MIDIGEIIRIDAEVAEEALESYLTDDKVGGGELSCAMRYSTLGGGKRIRACLVLEFSRLFGGTDETAKPFAAAIEMIHAYSLIHDDLPCMDDDDIRRGKPSCHKRFGEATALLAGDALLTYAFEVASSAENVSHGAVRRCIGTLSKCAGPLGMAGGQMIDLENSADSFESLKKLHSLKTSALIKAACLMGYFSAAGDNAKDEDIENISRYAECVGLAFQIKDDLLDLEGDEATLGKAVGIDEKNGRVNSLSFMTPDEARDMCRSLADDAAESLSSYGGSEFLRMLPVFLNMRKK